MFKHLTTFVIKILVTTRVCFDLHFRRRIAGEPNTLQNMNRGLKKRCFVPFCQSRGQKGFFTFPTNPEKRKKWLKLLQITSTDVILASTTICSSHFQENDILGQAKRIRLRKNAVPTLNLPQVRLI